MVNKLTELKKLLEENNEKFKRALELSQEIRDWYRWHPDDPKSTAFMIASAIDSLEDFLYLDDYIDELIEYENGDE